MHLQVPGEPMKHAHHLVVRLVRVVAILGKKLAVDDDHLRVCKPARRTGVPKKR